MMRMRLIRLLAVWFCGGVLCSLLALQAAEFSPALSVVFVSGQNVQLRWPGTAPGFVVEQADEITSATNWQPISTPVSPNGGDFTLTVAVNESARFFRLRQGMTRVQASSPVSEETGVAVTRETVVHFSSPLATNALITPNNFFAGFGGRRFLSRVELSTDRTKASLFYLEPLPGRTRVVAVFDGSGLTNEAGLPLDADGDGVPGGQAIITFETVNLTALTGTAVVGRVFASELVPGPDTGTNAVNQPLAGVTITVDGMEQTLRAVTDTNGNFTLSPAPPGRFFVHIDGRTVVNPAANIQYPDKAYYPFVGKAWEAVAGVTNNLAGGTGEIFLPLITAGTLQPVSLTLDTVISFPPSVVSRNPALAGVSMTVPANSLFRDEGTRGGKVGIAPVPPDRLPGPLPPGLEMPLVITVQTDGALNFDRPAPICFPNLPDPVLKTPLPAGSKQALISFNHDKGIWEAVGSMTVSADGKMICTDPGSGILQPGWHGVAPQPENPPGPPPCEGKGPRLASPSEGLECPLEPHCLEEGSGLNCLRRCADIRVNCRNNALAEFEARLRRCRNPEPPRQDCYFHHGEPKPCGTGPSGPECERDAMLLLENSLKYCSELEQQCINNCKECWPELSIPGLAGGTRLISQETTLSAAESVAEQIDSILENIAAKLQPFAASFSDIPPELREEIGILLSEADELADGWAGSYLAKRKVADEETLAAYARNLELEPDDLVRGNAPPYPVLYAATVVRRSELFVFRGETAPYGQYSVFVPRDGALLGVRFYEPRTKSFGIITPKQSPNSRYFLPRFTLLPLTDGDRDFDRDGLADVVEGVVGTDPIKADSDGDGILDGAEVDQGTNPLDGQPVRTGIIAAVKTFGAAVDVAAANDRLAVAQGAGGVSVFNLNNGIDPTWVAHFPAIGTVQRVAAAGDFVAAACGEAGVQIIETAASGTPAVVRSLKYPGAQAIAADNGRAYVGFASGAILALDLRTGLVVHELSVTNAVWDVALHGDHLYALADNRLFAISLASGGFTLAASINVPSEISPNRRLFVGGGMAYTVQGRGYNTIDVADPTHPVLLAPGSTAQFGWRHLVSNGSGIGIAAVGANPNSPADVSLYDLSDPRKNDQFLTQFLTPGTANAVAIHHGFAYVADGTDGLQVVNYLSFDTKNLPPTITLTTSAVLGGAESSQPLRVTANATDDVQVRQVEFYLDGQRTFSDGNFPFEYRVNLPALTATKTNVLLRARAVDTGGNATWSDELSLGLGPDVTPPRVLATGPVGGAKAITRVFAYFNEPMNPATLNAGSFRVTGAGPDGLFDTADDRPAEGGVVGYQPETWTASLSFPASLPDGLYRALVMPAATDAAGNPLANDPTWQFRVADAVFWISLASGSWSDASNWSTGTIPGPTDDVFLENLPGTVTVNHVEGSTVVRSLKAGRPLQISGGSTLQASDGIEIRAPLTLNKGTLKGSTVIQSAEARLHFAPNAANILDGMRIIGDLMLTNASARAVVRNGLELEGRVVLDHAGSITFSGSQTFNTGSILFGSLGALNLEPGTTLTLGPDMVVSGKLGIIQASAFGTVKLVNQGRIAADVPGGIFNFVLGQFENQGRITAGDGSSVSILEKDTLNTGTIDIQPGGTFTWNGSWTNQGTLRLSEGTLNLGGSFTLARLGKIDRTGGTLNLNGTLELGGETLALTAATGPWRMDRGTLRDGTVTQSAEARLHFAPNAANILDGMRITGDLMLTNTSARAVVRNGLDLTGKVVLDLAGSITFAGSQTFNTGSILFGSLGALNLEPGTTLTLGPDMVVRGKSGIIQASAFGLVKLVNQGLIAVDVPGGTLNLNPTQFENPGTLRADGAGSTIRILTAPFVNTGTIQELNGGKVLINP